MAGGTKKIQPSFPTDMGDLDRDRFETDQASARCARIQRFAGGEEEPEIHRFAGGVEEPEMPQPIHSVGSKRGLALHGRA